MMSVRKTSIGSALETFRSRYTGCVLRMVKPKLMHCGIKNEPILEYKKHSKERQELEQALTCTASECADIPIVIGDKEYRPSKCTRYQVMPHNHKHKLAKFYWADKKLIGCAIKTAVEAQKKWDKTSFDERFKIWETAGDLIAGKYRQLLNATTMLGQAKTVIQAEIDSACELADFIRIHMAFLKELLKYEPLSPDPEISKNTMRYRGIDGFVAAVTPFNFTAIGGNLAYTPALMGNAVLWKPSDTAVLSNWTVFQVMKEAGVPPGVVNFVPADGPTFGDVITASSDLSCINFTGSVPTFSLLWDQVGKNLKKYKNFPRLTGECGGKNFHFVHPSADVETVIACTLRGAFEYSGQKCSATSRLYIPQSLCAKILDGLVQGCSKLKVGDVCDFSNFTSAVIDQKAFERINNYINYAKKNKKKLKILAGGCCDNKTGYFIEPTVVMTTDPSDKLMTEEIFGPVVTVFVYPDNDIKKTMELARTSTKYALTGAVFAQDKSFLKEAREEFKMAAGNFYINDKSTGSVVGQQPFGGGRLSGTNDKAGGPHYILKFTSPQSIKETYVPLHQVDYPYMKDN